MRQKMTLAARRELLGRTWLRYRQAWPSEKRRILDEFVSTTGYNRKHAVHLLNRPLRDSVSETPSKRSARRYDDDVRDALVTVWRAANQICSKRLGPFLPELVSAMERFGHLALEPHVRERLLAVSAATVDRLLLPERHPNGKGVRTTRPGLLLKRLIPVRTFADWSDVVPGFLEGDLVAHCGTRLSHLPHARPIRCPVTYSCALHERRRIDQTAHHAFIMVGCLTI